MRRHTQCDAVRRRSAHQSMQTKGGGRWGGAHLFASFGAQYSLTSKSLTSLTILDGTSHFSASKRVTKSMPHSPATSLSKKVWGSCPREVRVPRPVTTTCEARRQLG